jgi:phosphatidate phosphatase APP1
MADDDLPRLAHSLGRGVSAFKRRVIRTIRRKGQPQVVPYRGYGNHDQAYLTGRVMLDPGLTPASAGEVWWRNLVNTYKRAQSNELAGAEVVVHAFGTETRVKSDEEGFFHVTLAVRAPLSPGLWHTIELELFSPRGPNGETARAAANIMIPPPEAQYGVISDLDDTVIRTDVTSIARMIRAVALGNAHTRLPFHGVAAFYEALYLGTLGRPTNPIFYVSSSPWNLYDLLEEFLEIRGIPAGPIILRDWGLGVNPSRSAPHKLEAIEKVLDTYPELPFVLIGDSGQEDPEIYREVIARYPERIRAAYIRNVTPHPERSARIRALIAEVAEAGSTMVLADDTLAAARHALEHGWILPAAIDAILADEAAEDAQGPAPKEDAGPAPTIVVEPEAKSDSTRPD